MGPRFARGDRVRLRADPGKVGIVVDEPSAYAGGWVYDLFISEADQRYVNESQLEVAPKPRDVHLLDRDGFLRSLVLIKLDNPLTDLFYSYQASRTQAEAYQFKPVLKFLDAPVPGILIADEVGLGKTIEAAILYLELKARTDVNRVLVVCPAGLRDKWRSELSSRFDEQFTIMRKGDVAHDLRMYAETAGRQPLRGIVGLETIRSRDLQGRFDESEVTYDLVIIDEAHHLRTAGRLSNAIGERLSALTDNLVLLTATPLQTAQVDLYNLLRFIDPVQFTSYDDFQLQLLPNALLNKAIRALRPRPPDTNEALRALRAIEGLPAHQHVTKHPYYRPVTHRLEEGQLDREQVVQLQRDIDQMNVMSSIYTRTRKSDVSGAAKRTALVVRVPLSDPEREFYEAVFEHAKAQARARATDGRPPAFAGIMRERQAASCIAATCAYYRDLAQKLRPDLGVEDSSSDVEADDDHPDRRSTSEEQALRRVLLASDAVVGVDSKLQTFVSAVRDAMSEAAGGKVIVFSYFLRTLGYLEKELRTHGVSTMTIHGGIAPAARTLIIDDFRTSRDAGVLLTSEVGAEGLDFQFCDTMMNYDLPWNPMRVEQRIGRIDRYGQMSEKVRIISLVLGDTVEERILERLYRRIGIFEDSIGDLEPILGPIAAELTREVFTAELTPDEQEALVERTLQMLVNRRLEEQELERRGAELLGNDALLMQRITDNVSSGRYVSPGELRALVSGFLEEATTSAELEDHVGDGTVVLRGDADLAARVQERAARDRDTRPVTAEFLGRLNRPPRRIPGTFDGAIAHDRRRLEFFNLRHPLVRTAVEYFRVGGPVLPPPVTGLLVRSDRASSLGFSLIVGTALEFALFLVTTEAAQRSTRLLPIVFDGDGGRDREAEDRLLRLVQDACEGDPDATRTTEERDALWDRAKLAASAEVDMMEAEAIDRNEAVVEVRLETLRRTYSSRIARRRELRDRATDERIVRMRSAEIANLEAALAHKTDALEAQRQVAVTYRPVAAGWIRVAAEATRDDVGPEITGALEPDPPLWAADDEPATGYVEPPSVFLP